MLCDGSLELDSAVQGPEREKRDTRAPQLVSSCRLLLALQLLDQLLRLAQLFLAEAFVHRCDRPRVVVPRHGEPSLDLDEFLEIQGDVSILEPLRHQLLQLRPEHLVVRHADGQTLNHQRRALQRILLGLRRCVLELLQLRPHVDAKQLRHQQHEAIGRNDYPGARRVGGQVRGAEARQVQIVPLALVVVEVRHDRRVHHGQQEQELRESPQHL